MRKIFYISGLFILLSFTTTFAQKDPPAIPNKYMLAVKKDSAYSRFQAEVHKWIVKANGRNTYAPQVKALFDGNNSMLSRVRKQFDAEGSVNTAERHMNPKLLKINPAIAKLLLHVGEIGVAKTMVPFTSWAYCDLINATTIHNEHWDANGENFFSVLESTSWAPSMKEGHQGFTMGKKVPDNPQIIAARVTFDYSFFYTGWDTYGAKNGMELVFGANKYFRSPTLDAWTDTAVFNPGINLPKTKYCILDIFLPLDSITVNFAEVHAQKAGSFTVEGLVKPNEYLSFNVGAGYMKGSVYGLNGHYLYGEFRLTKATITFLKSMAD